MVTPCKRFVFSPCRLNVPLITSLQDQLLLALRKLLTNVHRGAWRFDLSLYRTGNSSKEGNKVHLVISFSSWDYIQRKLVSQRRELQCIMRASQN